MISNAKAAAIALGVNVATLPLTRCKEKGSRWEVAVQLLQDPDDLSFANRKR